ncbi:hypothetical protein GJ744_003095 [Endocarpon pusillum]|uniref:Uncharacterized protein n=1 Tax=Endocarpon pusillum TaxID=364733 RepID=A0A8H7APJ2_9EURO|nr:hypothetical protein GJ744_003095 [Endocarpon pusillum]
MRFVDLAVAIAVAWGRERIEAGFFDSLMREIELVAVRNKELVVELCDLKRDEAGAGISGSLVFGVLQLRGALSLPCYY